MTGDIPVSPRRAADAVELQIQGERAALANRLKNPRWPQHDHDYVRIRIKELEGALKILRWVEENEQAFREWAKERRSGENVGRNGQGGADSPPAASDGEGDVGRRDRD